MVNCTQVYAVLCNTPPPLHSQAMVNCTQVCLIFETRSSLSQLTVLNLHAQSNLLIMLYYAMPSSTTFTGNGKLYSSMQCPPNMQDDAIGGDTGTQKSAYYITPTALLPFMCAEW